MQRTFAAALLLSAATALPVAAQQAAAQTEAETTAPADTKSEGSAPAIGLIRATQLLDGQVYAAENADNSGFNVGEPLLEIPPQWGEIGEVEDLALDSDGNLAGLVVEIGGFLGIGESMVLLPTDHVRTVRVGDDVMYLTDLTEEQLRELPEVDDTTWE